MSNNPALPQMMEATDSELMLRLAAGQDPALNELMNRWRDRVASFLFRTTGHTETAADLAQETFVKLYQARRRYRPEGKFSTYLFGIAANLGRNHARWKMRHPTVSLEETTDGVPVLRELIDSGQTPDEAACTVERLHAIHRAFQGLASDLRETMSLFIYEDMGYAEIASVVGSSPKAVETRIYRARQILKEQLKNIRS